jgi:[acyl-carrier-protein] S-malonyltransferase
MTAVVAHSHAGPTDCDAVAAYVDGEPLLVASVDHRMEQLLAGPLAARLPRAGSAQHRNMRRWLVQLLSTQLLLEHEIDRRSLEIAGDGTPGGLAMRDRTGHSVQLATALQSGGIAAAVLAGSVRAAAVARAVTAAVAVTDSAVRGYFERNADLYPSWEYARAESGIRAELIGAARSRAFTLWLDAQVADRIQLSAGFEHPADPRQPDASHHH